MPATTDATILSDSDPDVAEGNLRLFVVDQNGHTLAAIRNAASDGRAGLELVGSSGYGPLALTSVRDLQADLVVVSAEEPLIRATDTIQLLTNAADARWVVVAMSTREDPDLFRKLVLAGVRDVLVRSRTPAQLRDSMLTAHAAGARSTSFGIGRGSKTVGSIVTVFGDKGGVGKTTLATNLALSLIRETARSVALVDLDVPHCDVSVLLNLPGDHGFGEAVFSDDPLTVLAQLAQGPEGLRVLSGSLPAGVANLSISGEQLAELLTRIAELHDYVVVDTPPGINEFSAAALEVSALSLLVTTPELPCLRRTRTCLDMFDRIGSSSEKVKIVLNRASSRTNIDDERVREVLRQPIWARVRNDHSVLSAAGSGVPVVLANRQAPFGIDVRSLAQRIGNVEPEPDGFWRRLLSGRSRRP
jgi:pilus assembly protein CpaE